MKFFKYALVTLVILLFSFILPTAEALEITNITEDVIKGLQNEFIAGTRPELNQLKKPHWNCKLYGMRSRLQSTKKADFYRFKLANNQIKNSGSQIIKDYKSTETGLFGQTGPLTEEVRLAADGRLIGEMSIKKKSEKTPLLAHNDQVKSIAKSGNEVIAYSVCN
ncbi:MAG: hypothetical protein KDD58_05795 [Bdellovibrionales bacterium]|nr:hypothetical protein [Bdellovibrionales bacterium]